MSDSNDKMALREYANQLRRRIIRLETEKEHGPNPCNACRVSDDCVGKCKAFEEWENKHG